MRRGSLDAFDRTRLDLYNKSEQTFAGVCFQIERTDLLHDGATHFLFGSQLMSR